MAPKSQPYPQLETHPFLLSFDKLAELLGTNLETGLPTVKVQELQRNHPPNELENGGGQTWHKIFIKQLTNAMILVLVFAMALSFGVGDYIEGGVLVAVIVLNVSIGFFQEYKAEKKMDSLRALSSPSAAVLRDGKVEVIPSAQVVQGDIIVLKTGDTVPADLRLFEAMNLNCDEKSLTGEAEPVEKITEHNIMVPGSEKPATAENEVGVGDRVNLAYATTTVTKGRGRGIVTFTGMQTEVGKIAASTTKKNRKPGRSMNYKKHGPAQPVKGGARRVYDFVGKFLGLTEGTPLQRKLSKLAYLLFGCAIFAAIIVFGVNKFNVTDEVAIYAISTGIAIIPESLIAVLTITMVVGMTVMRKANVVIRDLSALEALGGVTNICSDKTGTLTQGAMIVKKVWLPKVGIFTVVNAANPSNPEEGSVTLGPEAKMVVQDEKKDYDHERSAAALKFDIPNKERDDEKKQSDERPATLTPQLESFLRPITLCNLAMLKHERVEGRDTKKWQTNGEPTEIALQVFAQRFDVGKKQLESNGWKQVAEFPFDSSIKRMSVVYSVPNSEKTMIYTKGAVERVLDLCSTIGTDDSSEALTTEIKDKVIYQMDCLADQGQRVLAVASRTCDDFATRHDTKDSELRSKVEQNLNFIGLVGIYDPPRDETRDAIKECSTAGIKVHMLTGDHPATATAIAKEVGIIPRNLSTLPADVANTIVQKATDFDALTPEEIDALPALPLVIARCAPDTKTKMIEALRRRKKFMVMTGDGVNDAPSLSSADVGIAMGLSGSDVAKSAAKIVLVDDNFASIVSAIREGRRMFDNIQKFALHLLASNIGEVILLIAGLGFQDAAGQSVFPLSPLQILWINMLTSSFPAFGLGREKASKMIMKRKPHDMKYGIFTPQIMVDMIVYGTLMGTLTLLTFVIIIYGTYGGRLGHDCNRAYNNTTPEGSCEWVFKARAAVFAELTWLILISAWEFKHLRRSMFSLDPQSTSRFPFFKDVYENKFLFWAVFIGALSVFPTVYIPGLNTAVFKHIGITWEWSLSFGGLIVYVLGVEFWKWVKRTWKLFDDGEESTLEKKERMLTFKQGFASRVKSTGSIRSLTRRGTGGSQLSAKEKVVDMGVLGAAPARQDLGRGRKENQENGRGDDIV